MMNIVVKEIDQFISVIHPQKVVSEYLVYLRNDEQNVSCFIELGKEAKDERVLNLMHEQVISDPIINNEIDFNLFVKEICFNEFKDNNKLNQFNLLTSNKIN